jgi:hypothetical protein
VINKIPIIGWILSTVGAVSLAIPFWICWSVCNVGKTYFYFIPEVFQDIPFWNCVGLFIVIAIIKGTFTPKLFNVSNTQTQKEA